jgi:hypothetical protein
MQDQLAASMQGPPLTNGSQYGRWNGVGLNGFGLAPSAWPSLYGYKAPPPLAFQPPWGHNGAVGNPLPPTGPQGLPPPSSLPQLQGGQMPQFPGGQLPQLPQGGQLPQLPTNTALPKSSAPPPKVGGPMPPGMDPANWAQAPQAPTGGPNQQFNFANSIASQSQSPTGQKFLDALRSGFYGPNAYAKYLATTPQSGSVGDFNQVAQSNPVMASQMLAAGGQQYRDAVMAANHWTNQQLNSFINQYGSGALPGFGG